MYTPNAKFLYQQYEKQESDVKLRHTENKHTNTDTKIKQKDKS